MFGYLVPVQSELSKELKDEYRARYCGLCRAIGMRYGNVLRTALSYEMTFLILLLDGISGAEASPPSKCIKHPLRKSTTEPSPNEAYAADLTILLLAAKQADDAQDEKSRTSRLLLKKFLPKAELAAERRPTEAAIIKTSLQSLSDMETAGEIRPDLPAGCFGKLVGEVFAEASENEKELLYRFGCQLGKLLYLMDAVEDLRSDLKHERYNPLVSTDESTRMEMLDLLSGDMLTAFEALPTNELTPLQRNILEHGIWMRFRGPKAKQEEPK